MLVHLKTPLSSSPLHRHCHVWHRLTVQLHVQNSSLCHFCSCLVSFCGTCPAFFVWGPAGVFVCPSPIVANSTRVRCGYQRKGNDPLHETKNKRQLGIIWKYRTTSQLHLKLKWNTSQQLKEECKSNIIYVLVKLGERLSLKTNVS